MDIFRHFAIVNHYHYTVDVDRIIVRYVCNLSSQPYWNRLINQ